MDQITPAIPPMAKADLRGMVARTFIEVLRGLTVANFGTPNVGSRIEDTLISIAVVIGHAENRLMSASDISNYLGMPRPTVIRKLRTVAMTRMLGKLKDGNRACYYLKHPNDESVMGEIRKIMTAIQQCCDGLSKMNTEALDRNNGKG